MKNVNPLFFLAGLLIIITFFTGFFKVTASPIAEQWTTNSYPPPINPYPPINYEYYFPVSIKQVSSTTIPTGVNILDNHSYYVSDYGNLYIFGEVINNTGDNLWLVKISANFFNDKGSFLDTASTFTYLDNLPAGDKTCFEIMLEEPSDWAYYQFEKPTYWTDGSPLPNLSILNDNGFYNNTYDRYELIGQVRNDLGIRIEYVYTVGTLYNSFGKVIGCNSASVNSTNLNPGQISAFKIIFSSADYSDVSSYRLQADGDQ